MSDTGTKPKGILATLLNYVPKSITITGDPARDSIIFKFVVVAATFCATWLYTKLKLTDPDYLAYLTGAITAGLVVVLTMIAGFLNSRILQAKSMNAALNLQASGASRLVPAETVSDAVPTPGAVVNKPITPLTAQEIVKRFGNVTVPVSDETLLTAELNRSQVGN
jgi:hypothetical protein